MPKPSPAPHARRPRAVRGPAAAFAALLALALPAALPAQAPAGSPPAAPPPAAPAPATLPDDGPECLGFAFGRWTPALDAAAAGHAPVAGPIPQAPNGRDWAAAIEAGRDTTLMLFPSWWPAGVHVRLPARRGAAGDTVRASATALVADGRVRAPTSAVLVWTVRC